MDITLLLKSFIILVILLGIALVFFLSHNKKTKKKKTTKENLPKTSQTKEVVLDFDAYMAIIKNRKSDTQALQEAVDNIIKHYGKIPPKLGIRLPDDYYRYEEILLRLCRHKNTNKDVIISFYKRLLKQNPNYTKEINDALTKGLNSLGV